MEDGRGAKGCLGTFEMYGQRGGAFACAFRRRHDSPDVLLGNGSKGIWGEMAETSGNGYDRKPGRLPGVKYYERMRELGCFTLQDVTEMVGERVAVPYLVNFDIFSL